MSSFSFAMWSLPPQPLSRLVSCSVSASMVRCIAAIIPAICSMKAALPPSPAPAAAAGRCQGSPWARGPGGGDGLAARFLVAPTVPPLATAAGVNGLPGTVTPSAPDATGPGVWIEKDAGGAERARGVCSSSVPAIPVMLTAVGTAPAIPGGMGGSICGSPPPEYVGASCAAAAAPTGEGARVAMAAKLST